MAKRALRSTTTLVGCCQSTKSRRETDRDRDRDRDRERERERERENEGRVRLHHRYTVTYICTRIDTYRDRDVELQSGFLNDLHNAIDKVRRCHSINCIGTNGSDSFSTNHTTGISIISEERVFILHDERAVC